jgi:hypothetical protein
MHYTTASDLPAALVMGTGFLAFGLIMILMPAKLRAQVDRFADSWETGTWHSYKMPDWVLHVVGAVVIGIATLFFYIAYAGLNR